MSHLKGIPRVAVKVHIKREVGCNLLPHIYVSPANTVWCEVLVVDIDWRIEANSVSTECALNLT